MKYKSTFDIIGPIMVGPSSSHTAGAVRIGKMARIIFNQLPSKVTVTFYGSFAKTYKGHGTAVAIVAGVLGFDTDDERIPDAIQLAENQGIKIEFIISQEDTEHSNTVTIELLGNDEKLNLTAISIGGGSVRLIELNHCSVLSQDQKGNELIVVITNPDVSISLIVNMLEQPIFLEIQSLSRSTIYLVQSTSNINQNLLTKILSIPGTIAVLPLNG